MLYDNNLQFFIAECKLKWRFIINIIKNLTFQFYSLGEMNQGGRMAGAH